MRKMLLSNNSYNGKQYKLDLLVCQLNIQNIPMYQKHFTLYSM